MDGLPLVGGDGTPLVNGITDHVDNATEGLGTDGDHDGRAGVVHHLSTDQTLGTVHGDGTHGVLSEMLGNLARKIYWNIILIHLDFVFGGTTAKFSHNL